MASRDIYQQTFDEDVQQYDQNTWPECSGRVATNVHETVCEDCGLVIADEQIDPGPEYGRSPTAASGPSAPLKTAPRIIGWPGRFQRSINTAG